VVRGSFRDRREFLEIIWIARGGLNTTSLDRLGEPREGTTPFEPRAIDDPERTRLNALTLQGLGELSFSQWRRRMRGLDSGDLDLLVEVIEEVSGGGEVRAKAPKVWAVYSFARIMRTLRKASEEGRKWVPISDYVHILQLRRTCPGISNREIARALGTSEGRIRRLDTKAKHLGVTDRNHDATRLAQIVTRTR
jgi:hypothetical protein